MLFKRLGLIADRVEDRSLSRGHAMNTEDAAREQSTRQDPRRPGRRPARARQLAALLAGALLPARRRGSVDPPTPAPSRLPTRPGRRARRRRPSEHVKLLLSGGGRNPLFAPLGSTIVIYGRVTPYQPGQRTTIAFYLGSRQVGSKVLQRGAPDGRVGQLPGPRSRPATRAA